MTASITATSKQSLVVQRVVPPTDDTSQGSFRSMSLESLIPAQTYDAGTSPNGVEAFAGKVNLVAGALTLDLTSMVMAGETINFNGMKLREFQCVADPANAGPMSIGTGATNGYAELGTISNIRAGNGDLRHCVGASAVDATHKTLDLVGSGTDGISILLVFGT